jgi:5-methylcytosine-specific restriction endonuclease McrA
MTSYSLSHLADGTLLRELADSVSQERTTTARMLAEIAEVDERRLYLPAGYGSMFMYCLHELHMSEDVAYKRIRAARAARQFPAIFPAVADGRLHLAAVVLLTPHLTPESAGELLASAEHRTKAEIELLLAQRFPQRDVPTLIQPVAPAATKAEVGVRPAEAPTAQLAPGPVGPSLQSESSRQVAPLSPPPPSRTKPAPLSPGRYALQVTVDQETYDQLRHAQALLGHAVPSGDVAEVLKRALNSLVRDLEKRKLAKCDRPRPQRGTAKGRHIPAAIKRAVVERDGGRCTFVSEQGKRCDSRTRLELDHVEPLARGGEATVAGIRLLCRAHNQHAADRALGEQFMDGKRRQARERTAVKKAEAAARAYVQEPIRAVAVQGSGSPIARRVTQVAGAPS